MGIGKRVLCAVCADGVSEVTEWWILFWTMAIIIALCVLVYRAWRIEFGCPPEMPEIHLNIDGREFIVRGNFNRIIVRHRITVVGAPKDFIKTKKETENDG